ncbi:MAG: RrF2 family transcriptional regulator [Stackebrandtia sp.]
MRMNEGVEWALHCCLNLAWVGERAVTAARLAAFYELPAAYLNKQLQALARAGILSSVSGPKGGFRLDRRPEDITLLEVVVAIDGPDDAFRCTEILHRSPFGDPDADYVDRCVISRHMRAAELTFRRELATRTLADIKADVEQAYPGTDDRTRGWFADG